MISILSLIYSLSCILTVCSFSRSAGTYYLLPTQPSARGKHLRVGAELSSSHSRRTELRSSHSRQTELSSSSHSRHRCPSPTRLSVTRGSSHSRSRSNSRHRSSLPLWPFQLPEAPPLPVSRPTKAPPLCANSNRLQLRSISHRLPNPAGLPALQATAWQAPPPVVPGAICR